MLAMASTRVYFVCVAVLLVASRSGVSEPGKVTLVSVTSGGVVANSGAGCPSMSTDGTRVAFVTNANNLHPLDVDELPDIYVKDLVDGGLILVSTSSTGIKANNETETPALSGDGNKVAFTSFATNLVIEDVDSMQDIYVKDLSTGELTLASTSSSGTKADKKASNPSLSEDGVKMAFASSATNLHPDDSNPHSDVFVKDLVTGEAVTPENTQRESIKIQALLGRIGESMGFKVWIPRGDKSRVEQVWQPGPGVLLDDLPLNYDETTLQTIENIDVLWLKGRAMARAFEVEHSTAVYSGLLRMADLLALQPNMDIKLHIVAPVSRREKVFQEIQRPVFSLLERRPLMEMCTFVSYDSLRELAELDHLSHLSDSVLDDYSEEAE